MCIVIDTNTLNSVFNTKDLNHHEFSPVYDWIMNKNGKVVYGGSKYLKELKRFLVFFNELKKINKAVLIDTNKVDDEEKKVSQIIVNNDFDDQHIVGLLRVSKCKLICSLDERAYPFFTHKLFFDKANKPKIYKSKKNKGLLNNTNIAEICLPCATLNKEQISKESQILEKLNSKKNPHFCGLNSLKKGVSVNKVR